MAKNLKLTLTQSVVNDLLPYDHADYRMNNGSLLLIDFSSPEASPTVPANLAKIKNIAWQNAQRVINPALAETDLSPDIVRSDTALGMKLEITEKKGLHGIVSQVNDIVTGNDFRINVPIEVRNYIYNNVTNGFFVSIWDRKTRLALTGTSSFFMLNTASSANCLTSFLTGGSASVGKNLGFRGGATELNSLSNQAVNVGFNVKTGTPAITDFSAFKFGSGHVYASFEQNKACSQILYQIHIVDLTKAGLTYAQMDALDYANFQSAFAVGGRFYNDTFTDPATFA